MHIGDNFFNVHFSQKDMRNLRKKNSGNTLMEITVTIIIIGVLASLAIPNYKRTVERAKVSEVVPILTALYSAQKAYYLENDTYLMNPASAADIANLEVTVPASKYFSAPLMARDQGILGYWLASAQRVNGASTFTMYVNDQGVISCFSLNATICKQMGY